MNEFKCDFRGEPLPTQKCQVCGPDKDRDIEVYQCHELDRPCSIHAHGLRQGNARTGPKLPVCIRCDLRTVDGNRIGPLSAIEIQSVRREQVQQSRVPCELQRTLAANVLRIREAAGLSLMAMATLAGCSSGLLERIESGQYWPSPERLSAIAQALQVTPAALIA